MEDLKGKAAWAGIKHLHFEPCLGFNGISGKPPKVSKNFMVTELSTPFALQLKSGRNKFLGMLQREATALGTSLAAEGCVCDHSYSGGSISRNSFWNYWLRPGHRTAPVQFSCLGPYGFEFSSPMQPSHKI